MYTPHGVATTDMYAMGKRTSKSYGVSNTQSSNRLITLLKLLKYITNKLLRHQMTLQLFCSYRKDCAIAQKYYCASPTKSKVQGHS